VPARYRTTVTKSPADIPGEVREAFTRGMGAAVLRGVF
jgi:hypothetical protein